MSIQKSVVHCMSCYSATEKLLSDSPSVLKDVEECLAHDSTDQGSLDLRRAIRRLIQTNPEVLAHRLAALNELEAAMKEMTAYQSRVPGTPSVLTGEDVAVAARKLEYSCQHCKHICPNIAAIEGVDY